MDIVTISDRFEFYCTDNLDINHVTGEKRNTAFLEADVEELQAAIKNGLKLPCVLLQTPEFDKDGDQDNVTEHVQCSFLVLDHLKPGDRKLPLYNSCKKIADQLINHLVQDADEFFEGAIPKTSEGKIGPLTDNIYGWGVNFAWDTGYDATLNPDKWRTI